MSAEKNYDMFLVIDRRIKLKIDELEKKAKILEWFVVFVVGFINTPLKNLKDTKRVLDVARNIPSKRNFTW